MSLPILQVKNLSKKYQLTSSLNPALDDISFTVDSYDRLAVFGPSGSGKTTLARLLKGLATPTSGSVYLNGNEVNSNTLLKNHEIQLVFQNPYESLTPKIPVFRMLLEPLVDLMKLPKDVAIKKINNLCKDLQIKPYLLEKFAHQLSGGERQRIALFRALLVNPKILICDEILSSLDQPLQKQVTELLLNYQQKHPLAILFITHDLSLIKVFCKRVLMLYEGRSTCFMDVEDLFQKSNHPFIQRSVEAINWLEQG